MASVVFLETSGSSIPTPPMSANTLFVNPSGIWQSKDENGVVTNIGQAGTVTGGTNLGIGLPVFSDLNVNNLEFNSISGTGLITTTLVGNTILVTSTAEISGNYVVSGSSTILNVLDVTVLSGTTISGQTIYENGLEVINAINNINGPSVTIAGAGNITVTNAGSTITVSGSSSGSNFVVSGSSTILNVLDVTVLSGTTISGNNITALIEVFSPIISGTTVNSDLVNTKQLEVGPAQTLGPASSAAIGVNNTVSGQFASAIGNSNTVLATNGLALGNTNYIYSNANNSVAISYNNQIFGQNSIAGGNGSIASGANSMAFGGGITLHPQSMVFTDGDAWTSTAPNQLTLGFQGGISLPSGTDVTVVTSGVNNIASQSFPLSGIFANTVIANTITVNTITATTEIYSPIISGTLVTSDTVNAKNITASVEIYSPIISGTTVNTDTINAKTGTFSNELFATTISGTTISGQTIYEAGLQVVNAAIGAGTVTVTKTGGTLTISGSSSGGGSSITTPNPTINNTIATFSGTTGSGLLDTTIVIDTNGNEYPGTSGTGTLGLSNTPFSGAYIKTLDGQPVLLNVWNEIPTGTINGSNTNFLLNFSPAIVNGQNAIQLHQNGLYLALSGVSGIPYFDYGIISGNTILMKVAPATNSILIANYAYSIY